MKNFMKIFLACSIFATSGWGTTATTLSDNLVNAIFGENTSQYFTMTGIQDENNITLTKIKRKPVFYYDSGGNEAPYPLKICGTMNGYTIQVSGPGADVAWNQRLLQEGGKKLTLTLDECSVSDYRCLFYNAIDLSACYLLGGHALGSVGSTPVNMSACFYSCTNMTDLIIRNYSISSIGSLCRECYYLNRADLGTCDFTYCTDRASYKNSFSSCYRLNALIVPPSFLSGSYYFEAEGIFNEVESLKIYSTGSGSSIEELFSPKLIQLVRTTYPTTVTLMTDVPPGYEGKVTRPHYDLVIAGTKNEIKSPEDTTILSIDKDAVVGMANGAVLTNSGQIKGPDEGSAYFKLYGGAKSATITNKASFAVDSSLSDRYSGKTCYVPSIAVFDTQHITLDDGITVTTEKADLAKHPEIIGSSSNVVVLATPTESSDPIKISQTGSTPLTVNAAFANDTTDTNLKPRDLEISGKVNLAGDLSKFTNGTLKITNSKFEFKTKKSLPQNVECTDSVVKLPRGADITGRIAAKGRSRLEIRCNHIRSGARISFK